MTTPLKSYKFRICDSSPFSYLIIMQMSVDSEGKQP